MGVDESRNVHSSKVDRARRSLATTCNAIGACRSNAQPVHGWLLSRVGILANDIISAGAQFLFHRLPTFHDLLIGPASF